MIHVGKNTVANDNMIPNATAMCWDCSVYAQCSIEEFFDSPAIRTTIIQAISPKKDFNVSNILRWGAFKTSLSSPNESTFLSANDIANAGHDFAKILSLKGESRRSAEMFSHFLQSSIKSLDLYPTSICFGSDGIVNLLSSQCNINRNFSVHALASELHINNFPLGLIRQSSDQFVEVATLFYPFAASEDVKQSTLLVLNQKLANVSSETPAAPLKLLNHKVG